ncbi:tRNA-dihydrouridine(47) synthase [NAD(P)(+)]-like-like protein [Drosera capensis]
MTSGKERIKDLKGKNSQAECESRSQVPKSDRANIPIPLMAATAATDSVEPTQPPPPSLHNLQRPSPEELVAKSIAPIKREFLRPPPQRTNSSAAAAGEAREGEGGEGSRLVKEKKSKRQQKRERIAERKSSANLCPEVARTEDANSCPYGDKCRFSHDIESFKAQKSADLDGVCPFSADERRCPYGLSCRFLGTHKDSASSGNLNVQREIDEVNGLKKDVQKLLWKNKMKFPKSDAALKLIGHFRGVKKKDTEDGEKCEVEDDHSISAGSNGLNGNACKKDDDSDCILKRCPGVVEENPVDLPSGADEIRPPKKVKSSDDDCSLENNGASLSERDADNLSSDKVAEQQSEMKDVVPESDNCLKLHPREKKLIDFREKLYLAPLTTVGNLPFRRVCKVLGADVTCGEMAMCTNLLQGQASEWALLRRHSCEDFFGVQICGAYPDIVARAVELIDQECSVDFIDINMGCPIDIVVNKGAGSALLMKPMRMMNVRTGYFEGKNCADSRISELGLWGASAVTVHGRTRQQRYSKVADWNYIYQCVKRAPDGLQVLGNGDVFSYLDWNKRMSDCPELSSCMIARGALIKPWLFTEIKEQRHWDIRSSERLDILKDYVRFGLEHWGSDSKGVETTRHFLLEWLSYSCRYIPVGLLDVIPQRLNWRPPAYYGRDDLETLMASDSAADWIRISEMLLGKVPTGFSFSPKHKSNAYDSAENG